MSTFRDGKFLISFVYQQKLQLGYDTRLWPQFSPNDCLLNQNKRGKRSVFSSNFPNQERLV